LIWRFGTLRLSNVREWLGLTDSVAGVTRLGRGNSLRGNSEHITATWGVDGLLTYHNIKAIIEAIFILEIIS